MRIGIVTTWFERGAAMVSRAYRDILTREHDVFVYARGGEQYARGDPNWDDPNVTWGRRLNHGATPIDFAELRAWVRRQELGLLLFNEQHDWAPVVFARRELGIPLGAYVDYYRADTVPLFELYDFLLCNTRRHYSVFRDHPQAVYVPWGTNCALFNGSTAVVDPAAVVFFHSAGVSPERKGTLVALQAFQRLRGPCRFVLHIQGPLHHWPMLATACAADPRVRVYDRPVHAPGLYHLGDVYVYPTTLEGIGLTIAEALASGLPVITPREAPMDEFVHDGVNGRLVEPAERRGRADGYYWAECHCRPEAVAAAMQWYVEHRDELSELKRRARDAAVAELDWAKNAAGLPRLLESLRGAHAQRRALRALENQALRGTPLPPAKALARRTLVRLGILQRSPRLQHWIYQ